MGLEVTPQIWKRMTAEDQARYPQQGNALGADSSAFDKPPAILPLEREEQRQFWNWCVSKGISDSVVWHSTAHRTKGTLGTPDFIVPVAGTVLWLEFKLPGNKLSFHQEAFRASLERQGIHLHVVATALQAERVVCTHMLLAPPTIISTGGTV